MRTRFLEVLPAQALGELGAGNFNNYRTYFTSGDKPMVKNPIDGVACCEEWHMLTRAMRRLPEMGGRTRCFSATARLTTPWFGC